MALDLSKLLVAGVRDSRILEEAIPPASEADVLKLEGTIGFDLPDDYRNFLLTSNGGTINSNIVNSLAVKVLPLLDSASDKTEIFDVSYFFTLFDGLAAMLNSSLSVDTVSTLYSNYETYISLDAAGYPYVPENCLPIADAEGAGYFLLVLAGEHKNKILFYGNQYYEDPTVLYENVRLAGSSFTGFFDSLLAL